MESLPLAETGKQFTPAFSTWGSEYSECLSYPKNWCWNEELGLVTSFATPRDGTSSFRPSCELQQCQNVMPHAFLRDMAKEGGIGGLSHLRRSMKDATSVNVTLHNTYYFN